MPEIATTQVMQFHSEALEDGDLQVTALSGVEQISKPYEFTLELASTKPDIDAADVIRNPAWIGIKQGVLLAGSNERASTTLKIHGIVQSFEQIGKELELVKYRAVLVSKLKRLALTHQSRIFQDKKVPEIIKEVCANYDIEIDESKLGSYERRDYVVQYEETDLDFIHRWMQHEGIFYYLVQTEDREKMVLADTPEGYGALQGNSTFSYKPKNSETSAVEGGDSEEAADDWFKEEVITEIAAKTNMLPEKVILNDYNWEDPQTNLECEAEVSSDGIGIVYKYNSHYHTTTEGDRLAKIRAEEINCREQIFNGAGDSRGFRAGMVFTLEDHYRSSMNTDYLLTEVRHTATQAVALGSNAFGATYGNTFVAIPKAKKFRPVFDTPWPQIKGVMHAKVDGADAGTPYAQIDDKGRYKVRMPIDRAGGEGDGNASKYVRKSEPYAGPNQGMHFPLLRNSEVMLTHVDGNPDRPVIAGAMFNADNASVVAQGNTTQNKIATPGGTQFVMDDTVGQCFVNLKTKDSRLDMLFDATDGQEKMSFKSTDKNEIKMHSGDENLKIQSKNANTYMRLGKEAGEADQTQGDVTVTGGKPGFYFTTDEEWNQHVKKNVNIIIMGEEKKQVGEASEWTVKGPTALYNHGDWFKLNFALTYGIEIGFTADFKLAGGLGISVGAAMNFKMSAAMNFEYGKKVEITGGGVKAYDLKHRKFVLKEDSDNSCNGKYSVTSKKGVDILSNDKIVIQAALPPAPPSPPGFAAAMKAWASGVVAGGKAALSKAPPPPPPNAPPPPPPPPTPRIELASGKLTIALNPATSIKLDSSGITLKSGASELKITSAGITAKPMVKGG
jgi:type VI secretion system secreted protein VgrG